MEIVGSETSLSKIWQDFINLNTANTESIKKINFSGPVPIIFDHQGRRFSIDFNSDLKNYHKKKGSIKTELISKALGRGQQGFNILDLSAGLGIDAIFLAQLGYKVTALERNPIIYLALQTACEQLAEAEKTRLEFKFFAAQDFLKKTDSFFDCIYFDPMFPDKKKSALPRQEMILFRNLVGSDLDSAEVVAQAIESKKAPRIVVKRPVKAPLLHPKPRSSISGKLIRFDIYGGN